MPARPTRSELWARFRAAQDAFFAARNAASASATPGSAENLTAKEALLTEAEAIDTSDLKAAKAALRAIQERWETDRPRPARPTRSASRRGCAASRTPSGKRRAGPVAAHQPGGAGPRRGHRRAVQRLAGQAREAARRRRAAGDTRKAADREGRIATTGAARRRREGAAEFERLTVARPLLAHQSVVSPSSERLG